MRATCPIHLTHSGFPTKILYAFFLLHVCHMPSPSHSPLFDHPNNIFEKRTNYEALQYAVFSSLCDFIPNPFWQILLLLIRKMYVCMQVDQSSGTILKEVVGEIIWSRNKFFQNRHRFRVTMILRWSRFVLLWSFDGGSALRVRGSTDSWSSVIRLGQQYIQWGDKSPPHEQKRDQNKVFWSDDWKMLRMAEFAFFLLSLQTRKSIDMLY
jgi:hypothetical protein